MNALGPLKLAHALQKAVKGRKQLDVARALEITPAYLSDILGGRRKLSAQVAVRLKPVLKIDGRKLYLQQAAHELEFAKLADELPEG